MYLIFFFRIKVNLTKDCAGLWPRLLHDSFTDLALIEQTLTCDSTDNGFTLVEPSTNQPAFNVEQLEDVDEDESDLVLQRLDVEAMKITHKVSFWLTEQVEFQKESPLAKKVLLMALVEFTKD